MSLPLKVDIALEAAEWVAVGVANTARRVVHAAKAHQIMVAAKVVHQVMVEIIVPQMISAVTAEGFHVREDLARRATIKKKVDLNDAVDRIILLGIMVRMDAQKNDLKGAVKNPALVEIVLEEAVRANTAVL